VGQQTFYSGLAKEVEWLGASVAISETGVPAATDSAQVELAIVPLTAGSDGSRRRSPGSPLLPYEVVTNGLGQLVGQLISSGVSLVLPPNVTVNICITVDQGIPRDPESLYPTPDFAVYNGTAVTWTPLNITVVVVGNYTQVCGDLTSSGTYYAILRRDDWISYVFTTVVVAATTGVPTGAPTGTPPPTGAPTFATLPPAGISTAGWIVIGLGAAFAVAIAILIIVIACRPSGGTSEVGASLFTPQKKALPVFSIRPQHGWKKN
jgi:hypothetical protein